MTALQKFQITPKLKKEIRTSVRGTRRSICIGRSYNSAGVGSGTPIVQINGDQTPVLEGLPYLKTNFVGSGGFRKTLYTPSTLRIEVGVEWIAKQLA